MLQKKYYVKKYGGCGAGLSLRGMSRRVSLPIYNSIVLPDGSSCPWALFVSVIYERSLYSGAFARRCLISAVYMHMGMDIRREPGREVLPAS
jgi:hypothetical protein